MTPSTPDIPLIEGHMVLHQKRAHLVLETPLRVVRLLPVDVPDQRVEIGGPYRKQTITALPRELRHSLLFHPHRGCGLDFRDDLCRRTRRRNPQRKMDMVGYASGAKTFAAKFAGSTGKIGVQSRRSLIEDEWMTILGTEDYMHQIQAQRLRHGSDYMSGLQPSLRFANGYLGLPAQAVM